MTRRPYLTAKTAAGFDLLISRERERLSALALRDVEDERIAAAVAYLERWLEKKRADRERRQNRT